VAATVRVVATVLAEVVKGSKQVAAMIMLCRGLIGRRTYSAIMARRRTMMMLLVVVDYRGS